MSFQIKRENVSDADLDITSFMNLMVVLVPVLLLSLTFTQIRALEINLPDLTGGGASSDKAQGELEIIVNPTELAVYYPSGVLVKRLPAIDVKGRSTLDYAMLTEVMREMKRQLPEKKSVLIRSGANVNYQTLVFTMDAAKSYRTVVATDLVEVELFPEISLGDAS